MISIQTYLPKTLFPLIKSFWCLRVDLIESAYEEEIIPDGHHEIIFHLNSKPAKRKTGNDEWQDEPVAFFAGQDLRSFKVQIMPSAIIYGIRFQPHTQALFFKFPASITTDQPLSLDDFAKAKALWNCISEQPERTFSNLERFFSTKLSLLNDVPRAFDYVNTSVREILQCKGNIKIDRLVEETGISGRHLDNSFQKFVGVNPKTFCNLIKFSHFVNYRKNNPSKSLTECAHAANFYDQSHLIHLSNAITGKTPKEHFGGRNCINDFFIDT